MKLPLKNPIKEILSVNFIDFINFMGRKQKYRMQNSVNIRTYFFLISPVKINILYSLSYFLSNQK